MGLKIWQISKDIAVRTFHLIAVILLSLLLPLSFLLLARLSSASYILALTPDPPPKSLLNTLFIYTNPNLIHALVSIVSMTTLISALTGRPDPLRHLLQPTQAGPLRHLSGPSFGPCLHGAWFFMCTMQLCVGLGIEATVAIGVDRSGFDSDSSSDNRRLLTQLMFFLGLHEAMAHWAMAVVRPVVEDTVYGGARQERWVDRWALAAGFGTLSWWRLRDEVVALVAVVEVKKGMMMEIGFGDFIGWWLYYVMVVVGVVKVFKGVLGFVMSVRRRRIEDDYSVEYQDYDDKV